MNKATQPKDGKDPPAISKSEQSKGIKRDKPRLMNLLTKDISLNQDYLNVKTNEEKEVKRLTEEINKENRTINATNTNKLTAIQNEKAKMEIAEITKLKNEERNQQVQQFKQMMQGIQTVFADSLFDIKKLLKHFSAWESQKEVEDKIQETIDSRILTETELLHASLKTTIQALHPEQIETPEEVHLNISDIQYLPFYIRIF